jgi:pimeloyl-ACP methyl ester carboxylesterase
MEYVVGGTRIYCEIHGEGRPFVLVHGFGPDHRLMKGCLEPIFRQREGWQRVYFDLPGMGRSPGPAWLINSDQMLDVVSAFIETVIPNQSYALAGQSYGAYLARGLVYRQPAQVEGLLLICPLILASVARRTLPERVTLVRDPELLATLRPQEREGFESLAVVQSQAIWERTRDEVNTGCDEADEPFLARLQGGGYALSFDVDALSAPYQKPALFLAGRQDAVVGYRDAWQILAHYPRATYAILDRAGHNLQIEQASLFDTLVGEWLDRVEEVSL